MKIGIIGAGKLGCALVTALHKKGYNITGIYSRSGESFEHISGRLKLEIRNDLIQAVADSDVIFITVPDSMIEPVAEQISLRVGQPDISNKTFFHCSGALTSDDLSAISKKGGNTASLHPIQTFADKETAWEGLEGICFGFEGNDEARRIAEEFTKALNAGIIEVSKENKPLYHSAACVLSNYLVTISYIAGTIFEKIGIDPETGVRAYKPLIEKTLENIFSLGSKGALTGPIARGDSNVLEKHIREMELKNNEVLKVYKELGKKTVELAVEKGSISIDSANKLIEILK